MRTVAWLRARPRRCLRHRLRPASLPCSVLARRTSADDSVGTTVIAVDANGADQGPAAVAEGVRRSGVPVLLFGPASRLGGAGPRAEVVDAPVTVKAGGEPVAAVRSKRDASIVQAARAVGVGRADALVSAGFTGNVALKVLEGTSKVLRDTIRERVRSGPVSSVGGLLIRGKIAQLRDEIDPERVGGAILLGLRKPVVVAHGSFGPTGIEHAVKLARRAVDEDMVGRTTTALETAGALRSATTASVASP